MLSVTANNTKPNLSLLLGVLCEVTLTTKIPAFILLVLYLLDILGIEAICVILCTSYLALFCRWGVTTWRAKYIYFVCTHVHIY